MTSGCGVSGNLRASSRDLLWFVFAIRTDRFAGRGGVSCNFGIAGSSSARRRSQCSYCCGFPRDRLDRDSRWCGSRGCLVLDEAGCRDAARVEVTSTALEAVGKSPSERVLWSDVIRLEYRNGGEDEPSGLAAKTGRWTWVWLVKDVDSAQAEAITDFVFRRFPLVTMAPEPPGLLENWFGRSETTRLNLNDQQK